MIRKIARNQMSVIIPCKWVRRVNVNLKIITTLDIIVYDGRINKIGRICINNSSRGEHADKDEQLKEIRHLGGRELGNAEGVFAIGVCWSDAVNGWISLY